MSIEEITLQLEERGAVWQVAAFTAIAAVSIPILSIYSDSQYWVIEYHRVAVTQMQWALIPAIIFAVEGVRSMFETKTTIRRRAIRKAIAEGEARGEARGEERGEARGERNAAERIRAELLESGVEITPEIEKRVFGNNGHRS